VKKQTDTASGTQKNTRTSLAYRAGKPGAVIIGGRFQGLGAVRNLARHGVPIYLLNRGLCIGRFSRYVKRFAKCPEAGQEELFFEFLIELAKKEHLEGWLIYPNDDETVRFLAQHKEQLEKYYRVTVPSWDIVKYAYDKELTYKLAEKCDIAIPKTFYPKNTNELEQLDISFPAIIKPTIKEPFYTRTKKKAIRVDNREELIDEYKKVAKMVEGIQFIIQELIPGGSSNLFSVGSVSRDGKLLAKVVAKRPRQHPMDFGHASTYAETVDIPELEDSARKILAAMGYYGLSEVEFMRDPGDGRYKLLEINARLWGWHTLAIRAGVDLPYLSYLDTLGEKVAQNDFEKGVKWIRLTTDIPTALIEIFNRRMKITDYLSSLKGKKEFAVFSMKDPLPFIAEVVALPYTWKKRGFW
jgi:predicted ATP-grasp superfamily ATP-dependent carboligase